MPAIRPQSVVGARPTVNWEIAPVTVGHSSAAKASIRLKPAYARGECVPSKPRGQAHGPAWSALGVIGHTRKVQHNAGLVADRPAVVPGRNGNYVPGTDL